MSRSPDWYRIVSPDWCGTDPLLVNAVATAANLSIDGNTATVYVRKGPRVYFTIEDHVAVYRIPIGGSLVIVEPRDPQLTARTIELSASPAAQVRKAGIELLQHVHNRRRIVMPGWTRCS